MIFEFNDTENDQLMAYLEELYVSDATKQLLLVQWFNAALGEPSLEFFAQLAKSPRHLAKFIAAFRLDKLGPSAEPFGPSSDLGSAVQLLKSIWVSKKQIDIFEPFEVFLRAKSLVGGSFAFARDFEQLAPSVPSVVSNVLLVVAVLTYLLCLDDADAARLLTADGRFAPTEKARAALLPYFESLVGAFANIAGRRSYESPSGARQPWGGDPGPSGSLHAELQYLNKIQKGKAKVRQLRAQLAELRDGREEAERRLLRLNTSLEEKDFEIRNLEFSRQDLTRKFLDKELALSQDIVAEKNLEIESLRRSLEYYKGQFEEQRRGRLEEQEEALKCAQQLQNYKHLYEELCKKLAALER